MKRQRKSQSKQRPPPRHAWWPPSSVDPVARPARKESRTGLVGAGVARGRRAARPCAPVRARREGRWPRDPWLAWCNAGYESRHRLACDQTGDRVCSKSPAEQGAQQEGAHRSRRSTGVAAHERGDEHEHRWGATSSGVGAGCGGNDARGSSRCNCCAR
eukprot:scaffold1964_cov252-Isochrysis_galbana.AAC.12